MTWIVPGAVNLIGTLPTRPGVSPYPTGSLAKIDTLVAHYLGDPVKPRGSVQGYGDVSPEAIARIHVSPGAQEEFPAIAYTWVLSWNGKLYQCHPLETITWQVAKNNTHTRGVVLTGFGRKGQPSPAQKRALATLWCALEAHLDRDLDLSAHRLVVANSECPGDHVARWLADVRNIAAEIAGEDDVDAQTKQLIATLNETYERQQEAFKNLWESADGKTLAFLKAAFPQQVHDIAVVNEAHGRVVKGLAARAGV